MSTNVVMKSGRSGISGTLALLALGAALIVGVAFPMAGVFTGESPRANFAFALIVISMFVALAMCLSYGALPKVQKIAHVAWLTAVLVCLGFSEYLLSFDHLDAPKTADTVLLFTMLPLTFPVGCIATGFTIVYSSFLMPDRSTNQIDLVVMWSTFFVAGYLQWFKIIPWLIGKWRVRHDEI